MTKFAIYISNFGKNMSAGLLADLAVETEMYGWDGFFIWDHILYNSSQNLTMVDPTVALAAIASVTNHIRIGTMLTPIARRRPWKLARELASLDHLSGGRLILGVGLGAPVETEYTNFGEEGDPKIIAEKLDEGIQIINGLWQGRSFKFDGKHYHLNPVTLLPTPLQKPRIPIWVGGFWPNKAPFRRAAQWDGIFPLKNDGGLKPSDVTAIKDYIAAHRTLMSSFDIVVTNHTPADDAEKMRSMIRPFIDAGMTWWLENLFKKRNYTEALFARIKAGPPVL